MEVFSHLHRYINECGKIATEVIKLSGGREFYGTYGCNIIYGNYSLPLKDKWKRIKRSAKNGRN